MSHFIVDLSLIEQLEISLRKRLKPDEILLLSYIKSFPKGYYGSKEKLACNLGIGCTKVYGILRYFKEKQILIKEKNRLIFNCNSSQYEDDSSHCEDDSSRYEDDSSRYEDNNNKYNNNYN